MSRYDDLRRMREAKLAAKTATPQPVTKPPANSVTKPPNTKPNVDVTKPKGGRPTIGDKPMTAAERMRRYRARLRVKTPEGKPPGSSPRTSLREGRQ
jgi:hypothetical protein